MFSKAFQRKYALTDQGLKNTKSGAFWTVVTNLVVMGGMGILYLLMGGFMGTLTDGAPLPGAALPAVLTVGFVLLSFVTHLQQYRATYGLVYGEVKTTRLRLAERLRKLPLGYFGKRDLADLTETIMGDVNRMEHVWSHVLGYLYGAYISTAITAGALGAVCIAIRFVFMLVGGVSPYVWFATHFIDAILIGPVFMLMVAKVRKNGPFLLTSLVTGVVLVAATWMFPITGLVGGLLCELCLRAGQFRQKSWLVLGFFCFNLGFIGDFLPLWFTKESYLEYAAQMMDAGYMATMEGLLTWPVFGIIVLSILVGSILGALLGMKLMRKHFVKAGLAQ